MSPYDRYLRPTWFLDSDSPSVVDFATRAIGDAKTDVEKAVRLYYAVRDGVLYDPYSMTLEPRNYRASEVAVMPAAYCIQKANLLAGVARAAGLPSRVGFADVRNHLTTPKLREVMGSDLFVFHGFTELFVEGKWVKATPAFNLTLCQRFGVLPLEFDAQSDSIFHPFDAEGRKHMEYVRDRGSFEEFPFEMMKSAFLDTYPDLFRRLGEATTIRDELFRPSA